MKQNETRKYFMIGIIFLAVTAILVFSAKMLIANAMDIENELFVSKLNPLEISELSDVYDTSFGNLKCMRDVDIDDIALTNDDALEAEEITYDEETLSLLSKDYYTDSDSMPSVVSLEELEKRSLKYYDVPLGHDIQDYIRQQCDIRGVDFKLAIAVLECESAYNESNVSTNKNGTTDHGYFQVNSSNFSWMKSVFGNSWSWDNVYDNIDAGIYILADSMSYTSEMHCYLMVYNMGPTNAKKNWNVGRYSTDYSRKVVRTYEALD